MYYPPLFTPVRPFESRPSPLGSAVDVPVVAATGRENPLDLSTKPIRQTPDSCNEAETTELLMLDHRKLANLAASHSLSAMGRQLAPGATPAAILDPSLYRLAYGPEALAVPAPFCYDRATGVAVPTSLAGHQLMNSYLQQRERCLEQQQQAALMAARTSAQQAAVAAAFMDQAALPYSLRTAMTQREAAAALAATRGLYAPTMPTPMVLPAFSLYTDDKGAFTSLRNGSTADKAFLNGTAAGGALEAARFAEHLQRLREQQLQQHHAGKCNNTCCTGVSGLSATVPCACCMQSPSQAALCARSPIGCLKDPTTAATGKLCNSACDYMQPGLTLLHRPTATPSDLRLPVPNYGTTSSTEVTTSAPVFQPGTTWSTGLPSVSTPGKTAFSVPKKKELTKVSPSHGKVANGFPEKESSGGQDVFKRELDKAVSVIKKEPVRLFDKESGFANETITTVPSYHRKEHDVKSMLTPKTASPLMFPRMAAHQYQAGTALTTVTAVTPIVATKCEGGTIPKTKMPPVLEPYRPVDMAHTGEQVSDETPTVPSPQGPPPLIAVANRSHHLHPASSSKESHSFSITDTLRHQALLHGSAMSTPVKNNVNTVPSDAYKYQKSPKRVNCTPPKACGLPAYVKEEPTVKQTPPITLPKPVPQIPTAPHLSSSHYSSHYRPFALQNHPSWVPPANPNVTVSPTVPLSKTLVTTTTTTTTNTATTPASSVAISSNHKTVVKSEPLPVVNVKKEPEYDHNANVLQSLLVRPGLPPVTCSGGFQPVQPSVIMSNRSPYSLLEYQQYHHQLAHGLNLSHSGSHHHHHHGLVESKSPATASTAPIEKQVPKVECGAGLDLVSANKRQRDTPTKLEDGVDEKKRITKLEYTMAPGFAFQYPPFPTTDSKDVPLCPYTFVPEPPGYYESQMVVPKEIRPTKACSASKYVDVPRVVSEEAVKNACPSEGPGVSSLIGSGPPPPELPPAPQISLHLKNIRRSAQARARSKLRKRILARIYSNRKKAAAASAMRSRDVPEPGTPLRRYVYKIGKRRRIRSGLDMALKRNKKRRGIVYKIRRENAEFDANRVKASALSIPADMKKLMVNKALGETVLHRASRLGYPEVVAYCLETSCGNMNAPDNAGYTPLHECCSRGHLDIARALLQYGADVNASAAGGIRPLHDAVENDHVEVVRLLLSFGADPSIATYSGLTPLKLARSPLMAEFLQGFMADISGEMDCRPHLPWRFWGSASCLDPFDNGYDMFDGVPSDGEMEIQGDGDDFLFEVSDSPHLPSFRMAQSAASKAQSNYLRLSDVLRKTSMSRNYFLEHYRHIEVLTVPRHEFEASATCSQLLTGSKVDTVFANRPYDDDDSGNTVDLVRLDNSIRNVLGIETISVR